MARFLLVGLLALSFGPPRGPRRPIRCFRANLMSGRHAFLALRANGEYERGEVENQQLEWLDHGSWSAPSPQSVRLVSDIDVWPLEVEGLSVAPHRLFNVALVPKLKARLARFLANHPEQWRFGFQEVERISVLGGPCPKRDSFVCRGGCDGPWRYYVDISAGRRGTGVTRGQLVALLRALGPYAARHDLNETIMHLARRHGYTLPYFDHGGASYPFRATSAADVLRDFDLWQSVKRPFPDEDMLSPLMEVSCAEVIDDLDLVTITDALPSQPKHSGSCCN